MSTVTIERTQNGYVVTTDDGLKSVFEEPSDLGAPVSEVEQVLIARLLVEP